MSVGGIPSLEMLFAGATVYVLIDVTYCGSRWAYKQLGLILYSILINQNASPYSFSYVQ